ncbi:3-methyl-2-oxobutanoate hydroxymethyltransferase [Desulfovibrio ferrophilus]|uniref:3-methyl-2-oxobutanoate hydroxymethyltransferase n=1 Tax=Desulfovibrio ferrophilus TaxID=241368 RepID=A0A2Z6B0C2_9BACT|nr:3-methyl-2-oxobutanoate hydroxymethyltransferase [Desulfovibrio ferrophilus]BBD08880.1 3-methyl-2-oxobutanoatehydroxymethyltransferase [Desulfovibrio ferrophilus]
MSDKITVPGVVACKGGRKLSMLTAYDAVLAALADASGVDMILVGDSLAMVGLGQRDTLAVGMDAMIHHTRAVSRGTERALVVGDMPFMSYQTSDEEAVRNAGRFLAQGRASAIKLEGGARMLSRIQAIVAADIPVMGHIGLTPQSVAKLGGFKVQGKTAEAGRALVEEARMLEDAGCFSMVLEAVPAPIAKLVTEAVSIPTIGIGAGPYCDGQVLVTHDVLGLFDRFTPKFVKRYAELGKVAVSAMQAYREDVEAGAFPGPEHSFDMPAEEVAKLKG